MQVKQTKEDIPEIFFAKKYFNKDTFFDLDEFFIVSRAGFTYKDKECTTLHHSNKGINISNDNIAFAKWEKLHNYEIVNIPFFEIETHLNLVTQEHRVKRLLFLYDIVKNYFI